MQITDSQNLPFSKNKNYIELYRKSENFLAKGVECLRRKNVFI
jgi:hypothetical protein